MIVEVEAGGVRTCARKDGSCISNVKEHLLYIVLIASGPRRSPRC